MSWVRTWRNSRTWQIVRLLIWRLSIPRARGCLRIARRRGCLSIHSTRMNRWSRMGKPKGLTKRSEQFRGRLSAPIMSRCHRYKGLRLS